MHQHWRGRASIKGSSIELEVLFGELDIDRITLPAKDAYREVEEISHGKATIYADRESIHVLLTDAMPLAGGTKPSVKLRQ